jgi:hypothetical protein
VVNRNNGTDILIKRLNELKSKVTTDFIEKDWLRCEIDELLDEYMTNGGIRPIKEIPKQLDLMERLLVKTHENLERIAIRKRTREDWEEIERQFIPPEPVEVPEGFIVCACWNCNNIFEKRGKAKYCSDECGQEQQDANKRFKQTGTYLRPKRDSYLPNREENAGKKDITRLIYSDNIEKYSRIAKRKETGNRTHSPNRDPEKPTPKTNIRMGERPSRNIERQRKYESFIRGQAPGIFTINIKTGLKVYHENGKKHEYSEESSSIGA